MPPRVAPGGGLPSAPASTARGHTPIASPGGAARSSLGPRLSDGIGSVPVPVDATVEETLSLSGSRRSGSYSPGPLDSGCAVAAAARRVLSARQTPLAHARSVDTLSPAAPLPADGFGSSDAETRQIGESRQRPPLPALSANSSAHVEVGVEVCMGHPALSLPLSREASCPQGHGLQHFVAHRSGFACDLCGVRGRTGTPMWGCRACNYDICGECWRKASNSSSDP